MQTLIALLFVIAGFTLLIKSADWLIDGASTIARKFRISDLVIGLTIVSFGTSAPELMVNIISSLEGKSDFVIGTIVGSNISNTLLILGATAVLIPLPVMRSTVMKEIPFSLLAALVLLFMINDQFFDASLTESVLSRGDALVFLSFFVIFMYYTFGMHLESKTHVSKDKRPIWVALLLFTGGIVGLGIGGKVTIDGATDLAGAFGVSDTLIGLTVLALGTSLPELVTSVLAALKGKTDISVGNVVGSNIFNIFLVLGLSALVRPVGVNPTVINPDLLMVCLSTILLFIIIHTGRTHKRFLWWRQKTGHVVTRYEGALMLCMYAAYVVYVAMRG